MRHEVSLYNENLSLLTDLYQLTMAYAAWKTGELEKTGVFDLFFRKNPFAGGYAINCGLESVLELIESFDFSSHAEYLSSLKGADGNPLFEKGFVDYLSSMKLEVDIHAVEEGRVVFAGEPILRVEGPIIQCQLLETALLNFINFQTLIATKAARIKEAAGDDTVLEMGLRRAQGIDGSLAATRAAYIGGVDSTSNVLAGKIFGIPVRGTHAHSWVMSFDDELDSFEKFADAMPANCIFLVDTYNSLDGVENAIRVGLKLRSRGYKMLGIRLDSGDLAYLSIEARRCLDDAGLTDASIVGSNDLDEHLILSLKQQGAKINIWGIGTKLITANDQPALGGVFKLVAMKRAGGDWQDRIKLSEQMAKITTPGFHQVRRYKADGYIVGDMIFDVREKPRAPATIVDPIDPTRRKVFLGGETYEELLKPVVRKGRVVYQRPSIEQTRERCKDDLKSLHPTIRRFTNPHQYPCGLDLKLHEKKNSMILSLRALQT